MSKITRRGFLGGLAACAGLLLPRGTKQDQLPIRKDVVTGTASVMTVMPARMIGNGDPEQVMPLMRDADGSMGVATIRNCRASNCSIGVSGKIDPQTIRSFRPVRRFRI